MADEEGKSRKHLVLVVAIAACAIGAWLLVPHILEALIGGAITGAVALGGARKLRRQADKTHEQQIKEEHATVEALESNADADTTAAQERQQTDPQEEAKGLSFKERRARLDAAAKDLK